MLLPGETAATLVVTETGTYKVEVMASQNGENTQLETALSANVNSVTVGDDGNLTINLAGIGPVSMSDIKQYN